MNFTDQLIRAALREIEQQTWGATEQYMQIHDVVRIDSIPQIVKVDLESEEDTAIVYLQVAGEKFYLAIYFDTSPDIAIRYIGTESHHKVYLRATSENLTWLQIAAMSLLKPSETFNKDDKRAFGKALYKYSCAIYEPSPGPDTFENKLKNLLSHLEQDVSGVEKLINHAEAYIQVDQDVHNGNGLIGGPYIDKLSIKRMAALGLEIAFSQYATGNPFK